MKSWSSFADWDTPIDDERPSHTNKYTFQARLVANFMRFKTPKFQTLLVRATGFNEWNMDADRSHELARVSNDQFAIHIGPGQFYCAFASRVDITCGRSH